MSPYLFNFSDFRMLHVQCFTLHVLLIAGFLLTASAAWAGSNLVVNGHFDATNEFLYRWKYDYADTGNSWYTNNRAHVALTNVDSRHHVVALWGIDNNMLNFSGEGVILDSDPIAVTPGGRYKITVTAKTLGPNCRILVEGYRWRPGVKPHANPKLAEVRKCYKTALVFFKGNAGEFSAISPDQGWVTASQTFPSLTKLAKESYDRVQFLVVHIIALEGKTDDNGKSKWGTFYVDDVKLERIN